jgi:hypothetical protein
MKRVSFKWKDQNFNAEAQRGRGAEKREKNR